MENTHTSRFMKSNTKIILYHGSNQSVYQADIDWVKFVIQNRMNSLKDNADIVIGPTADGKLFSVVN